MERASKKFLEFRKVTNGCSEQVHLGPHLDPQEMLAARSTGKPQSAPDLRLKRQVSQQRGTEWKGKKFESGLHTVGAWTSSAVVARRRLTTMSRSESCLADEDVTLLLDTLDELSEAQAALCAQIVRLTASLS
jgi:hypothetical protein